MCVPAHDPLNFSFLSSFLFFDWAGVLWPHLSKVLNLLPWASSVPLSPSVPAETGCLFAVAVCVHVFISGESLHSLLVGVIKSYVIATSDLWLFIHAANLLPSLPTPLPYKTWRLRAGLEVEESHTNGRQCRGTVWMHWDSVAELSGTEAVRRNLTTKLHLHWWLIYNYSNRIRSLARRPQPGQPSLPTPRNAPRGCWCSSTLDGSWRIGSSVVGRLTNVAVPLNSWFCPAHFGLMFQERSETTSAAAAETTSDVDARWYHIYALGKRKGIWRLVWSFGNALCLYVNGLPSGSLTYSNLVTSV